MLDSPPSRTNDTTPAESPGVADGLAPETLDEVRWFRLKTAEATERLQVDPARGLDPDEARRRAEVFGENAMTQRRADPPWKRFLLQFNQALVYVLLVATGVAFALQEWVDGAVIFGVVLVNAFIGFFQEEKASQAIEALAKMIPTRCRVLRGGEKHRLDAREPVPGGRWYAVGGGSDKTQGDFRAIDPADSSRDRSGEDGDGEVIDPADHPALLACLRTGRTLAVVKLGYLG